ncbi:hypothetical protein GF591_04580, partial [Staphylococcus aureus]|nr:hypothetical protein [Staphylococcus aureus]
MLLPSSKSHIEMMCEMFKLRSFCENLPLIHFSELLYSSPTPRDVTELHKTKHLNIPPTHLTCLATLVILIFTTQSPFFTLT